MGPAGAIGCHSKNAASSGTNGSIVLGLDLTQTPVPSGTTSILSGQTWNWQCWFRDKNPVATSNFTDGVSVSFCRATGRRLPQEHGMRCMLAALPLATPALVQTALCEHVVTDLDGLIRGWEPQGAPRSRADLEGARSLPTQHSHGLDLGLPLPVGEWTRPEERSRLNSRIPMSNAAL